MTKIFNKKLFLLGFFTLLLICSFGFSSKAEAATNVYYSVGQNVTDHKTGTPTLDIVSGIGTFDVAQTATNMGVGDKVTFNTSSVCYISSKTSTSVWNLITATGSACPDVTGATVNSIAHAFSSLSAAVGGASPGAAGASYLNTANLVTGDYILNIPAYYDSGPDTTAVTINGWTTGADNYIRIYTATSTTSEVNQSQRHSGVWSDTKYSINPTNPSSLITINTAYITIEGIQINHTITSNNQYAKAVYVSYNSATSNINISNNIIKANYSSLISPYYGTIFSDNSMNSTRKIWNNIVYFTQIPGGNPAYGMYLTNGVSYVYNNTLVGLSNTVGLQRNSPATVTAKNNVAKGFGNTFAYVGTFQSGTDYNATDGTDNIGIGSNNLISQTFTFISETSGLEDFHLQSSDAGARDSGIILKTSSDDSNLYFTTDIDGNPRPDSSWDVGADEYYVIDPIVPVVNEFDIPPTYTSLTVPVSTFTASDNIGVTGYMITESATAPLPGDAGWSQTTQTSYTFSSAGAKTLYAWAKDDNSNVSLGLSDTVTVTPTYYIRAGAAGANNGSTWADAFSSFSAVTWIRGGVYYLAGGTYNENVTVSSPLSGSLWVKVKKANAADNSSDIDWNSSYATDLTLINGTLTLSNGYIEFDGVTGSGQSGHGIKINVSALSHSVVMTSNTSNYYLHSVEIEGPGFSQDVNADGIYMSNSASQKGYRISNNYIHNIPRNGVTMSSMDGTSYDDYGILLENNFISETGGAYYQDISKHGQGIQISYASTDTYLIIRNNTFRNIVGTGFIVYLGGAGAVHRDSRIYNNVFYITDLSTYYTISPGIVYGHTTADSTSNIYFYNNTVYGVGSTAVNTVKASVYIDTPGATNIEVKNNLYVNSYFGFGAHYGATAISNNNYYNNYGSVPTGETGQVTETSDPFVNSAGFNFELKSSANAIDGGADLSSVFTTDKNGVTRPADAWDIGAYEYVVGTTYTIGGTISGLSGTLVLQNNSGDNESISADGSFTFDSSLSNGASYAVTILTNPSGQTCTVTNGSGTVASANVTSVTVTCTTNSIPASTPTPAANGPIYGSTRHNISNLIASTTPPCTTSTSTISLTRNLSRGSQGNDVTTLQNFLVNKNFLTSDSITGYFGITTETAVKAFQKSSGLVSSGTPQTTGYGNVGPVTRAKINSLGSTTTCTPTQTNTVIPTSISYNFARNLSLNMTGEDVRQLQQFLNTNGFTISTTGAGSPGKETTLFGTLTYKALVKFQKSIGWSGTGFFGPITRAYVNKK